MPQAFDVFLCGQKNDVKFYFASDTDERSTLPPSVAAPRYKKIVGRDKLGGGNENEVDVINSDSTVTKILACGDSRY